MKRAQVLDGKIRTLAQQEREILKDLIPLIREMDVTKSYLELEATSIHDYLINKVGYSGGSACRRIDAARLSRSVPNLVEKIEAGEITLTQVALVKTSLRTVSKQREVAYTEARDLFAKLEGKSEYDTQKTVSQFLNIPIVKPSKITVQSDESIRLEVTLSKELAAKLRRAQELISHAVPTNEFTAFLDYVTTKIIQQKTKPPRAAKDASSAKGSESRAADLLNVDRTATVAVGTSRAAEDVDSIHIPGDVAVGAEGQTSFAIEGLSEKSTATVAVRTSVAVENLPAASPKRKSSCVSAGVRRVVSSDAGGCQHRHSDQSKCGSRWQLQADHRRSKWADGSDELRNLQPLCGPHNRWKYRKEAGIKTLSFDR